jgi:hypothetical protein
VGCGALLSLLIPPVGQSPEAVESVAAFEGGFEPVEVAPATILDQA